MARGGVEAVSDSAPRYPVPAGRHRVAQSIERSRFICTVQRIVTPENAQAFLRELNATFSDATHNCWAYVAVAHAEAECGGIPRVAVADATRGETTVRRSRDALVALD